MKNWSMLTAINPPRPQEDLEILKGRLASVRRAVGEVDTFLRDSTEITAEILNVLEPS